MSEEASMCFDCLYMYVPTDTEPCRICDNTINVKFGKQPTFRYFVDSRIFCDKQIVAKVDGIWKKGMINSKSLEFEGYDNITKISDIENISRYWNFDNFLLYKKGAISISELNNLRPYLLKRFGVQKMFIKS